METFGNLVKITSMKNRLNEGEVLRASNSMVFIKIQSVCDKDFPRFLKDLEGLIGMLDEATVNLYRNGAGA